MRPGGLQNMYGRFGKEKHFYPTRHLNPGPSRRQIVAVVTSPLQLSLLSCFRTKFSDIIFCEVYNKNVCPALFEVTDGGKQLLRHCWLSINLCTSVR